MSVLVTGGAGFIGSNLTKALLLHGHEVTVFDNLSEGSKDNLTYIRKSVGDKSKNLEFIKGDIRDYDLLLRVCDRKKWIFHMAAMSRIQPSISNPTLAIEQNLIGTHNVLECARKCGVSRVVYSASSSAYGNKNNLPLQENMKEDCLNFYSLTKKTGEDMCRIYNELYGVSTVSLRYFNVYGPLHQESGDYATVIAIFMRQLRHNKPMTIVGLGNAKRDFSFIGDVVEANLLAAFNREAVGVFNIGTGSNYSINEVAKLCAKVHGVECKTQNLPPRLGEANETLADITKAKKILGWKPTVDLETGLKVTYNFQKNNSLIIF